MLSLVAVTGCSSLMNPHVRWDRQWCPKPPASCPTPPTLQDGIAYAQGGIDQYKEAVGDQAVLTNGMAVTLIPLGAAALGLGVTGGPGTAVAALGATGAAIYGTGTWLSSRPRQFIYIAGIKAMTCAVDAVLPLGFSAADHRILQEELKALNGAIGTTTDRTREVRERLGVIQRRWPTVPAELIVESKADLRAGDAILQTARDTYAAGVKLDGEIGRAGQALVTTVDRLGAEVDRQIASTLPDLSALASIIGGLAQVSGQFTKLAEPPKAEKQVLGETPPPKGLPGPEAADANERKQAINELLSARGHLKDAAIDLENITRAVAAKVDRVAEARPLTALKQCGVESVDTGITVEPPGPIELQAGQEATRSFVVKGGKAPYVARLLEEPVKGLTVVSPVPPGRQVVVRATTEVAEGQFSILVSDAAGNDKRVAVTVSKPGRAGAPSNGAD